MANEHLWQGKNYIGTYKAVRSVGSIIQGEPYQLYTVERDEHGELCSVITHRSGMKLSGRYYRTNFDMKGLEVKSKLPELPAECWRDQDAVYSRAKVDFMAVTRAVAEGRSSKKE